MNDLWVFDPSEGAHGEWAWMGGSSNYRASGTYGTEYQFAASNAPGARDSVTGWTDTSGRLWLFGGEGFDSLGSNGLLNDLWVFDPSQGTHGEWAWMGGSEVARAAGSYGTEYQFADSNVPGVRDEAMSWTDENGKLWLFGGDGYIPSRGFGYWNDLWAFDPSQGAHGEWAWMGGSSTFPSGYGYSGVYGTEDQFATSSVPGGRNSGATWVDPDGKLWLFGGEGFDSLGNNGLLNDLWELEVPDLAASAVMTNPASGSTLSGASTTFTWTAGYGATGYFLWIGTSPGAHDIANLGEFTGTSVTVNLPTTGAKIYVRLWSVVNGRPSLYSDSSFTEAAPAAITSPVSGSTMTGSSTTFDWTAGVSGTGGYYLWIGTAPGAHDIANLGEFTTTSATLNLPATGATIYVRLWSVVNGRPSLYSDSSFTEANTVAAAMINPSQGSVLSGTSTIFQWTTGSNVTGYYLWIGTAPGAHDIANLGEFTTTSATLNLPTKGATIYVRLWSLVNGRATLYSDSSYTEATSVATSRQGLISTASTAVGQ
jgi:Galactose oxidase, central domain